jgi:hypothetical protein
MKSVLLVVILLSAAVSSPRAEICVKHHTHTDAYYYGGTTTPEVDRDFEIWFGEGKYAMVQEQVKWIFDVSSNTLTFIHFGDSIFLQTTLPPQWENIIVEEEVGRIQMYQYTGEKKELGEEKELDGHECTGHMLTTWIPFEDIKYNETDDVTWYTKDIPIDFDIFNKVYPCILALRNYSTELIETIGVTDGYPVRSEETRFQKGLEINTVTEIKDISEKDAPEGFWDAPEGFTEKDRLTIQELQGN